MQLFAIWVTGSSKKPFDYVLSSLTLDHMPKTRLDLNNAFMHAWQSNTFDHMPPTPDALVHQIDPVSFIASRCVLFVVINFEECTWRILACKLNESNWWLVTTVEDVYTCSMTRLHPDHCNATMTVLGALLVDKVADYTCVYEPKDIQRDLKIDLNIDISYKKAWRGRQKASDMAMGSPTKSFSQLPYYCHKLKMANEGTITHIETDAEGRFKLLYVGFGVAIWAFLTLMRPLIIINTAHLKGTYEGTNLLAVGMDDNNQIVPIATGVCQGGESTKAWSFFLSKLKESIGVNQGMTVISDRHPCIVSACVTVFPNAFHGLFTVLQGFKPGGFPKLLAAGLAADELMKWAAAKVHRQKLKSAKWIVDKRQVYQVNSLQNIEIVDLDSHECICRKWQLFGLPCSHVIATSVYLKLTNCCLFAKHWFRKTTVRETYKVLVYPLQGPSLWETPVDKQNVLLPTMEKQMAGRLTGDF
nr:hypothetical protein [Tanacetum cinerariifolium]